MFWFLLKAHDHIALNINYKKIIVSFYIGNILYSADILFKNKKSIRLNSFHKIHNKHTIVIQERKWKMEN